MFKIDSFKQKVWHLHSMVHRSQYNLLGSFMVWKTWKSDSCPKCSQLLLHPDLHSWVCNKNYSIQRKLFLGRMEPLWLYHSGFSLVRHYRIGSIFDRHWASNYCYTSLQDIKNHKNYWKTSRPSTNFTNVHHFNSWISKRWRPTHAFYIPLLSAWRV